MLLQTQMLLYLVGYGGQFIDLTCTVVCVWGKEWLCQKGERHLFVLLEIKLQVWLIKFSHSCTINFPSGELLDEGHRQLPSGVLESPAIEQNGSFISRNQHGAGMNSNIIPHHFSLRFKLFHQIHKAPHFKLDAKFLLMSAHLWAATTSSSFIPDVFVASEVLDPPWWYTFIHTHPAERK